MVAREHSQLLVLLVVVQANRAQVVQLRNVFLSTGGRRSSRGRGGGGGSDARVCVICAICAICVVIGIGGGGGGESRFVVGLEGKRGDELRPSAKVSREA